MSCITKILEVKGDKDFIVSGEIVIEGGGAYKGHEYLITFVMSGHRCGYVAIPESHPLYTFYDESYNYPGLDVHGGVTYFGKSRFTHLLGGHACTDKWIGFDAGHSFDLSDIKYLDKYFPDVSSLTRKYVKSWGMPMFTYDNSDIRDYSYMEKECHRLIDQLIDMEKK